MRSDNQNLNQKQPARSLTWKACVTFFFYLSFSTKNRKIQKMKRGTTRTCFYIDLNHVWKISLKGRERLHVHSTVLWPTKKGDEYKSFAILYEWNFTDTYIYTHALTHTHLLLLITEEFSPNVANSLSLPLGGHALERIQVYIFLWVCELWKRKTDKMEKILKAMCLVIRGRGRGRGYCAL